MAHCSQDGHSMLFSIIIFAAFLQDQTVEAALRPLPLLESNEVRQRRGQRPLESEVPIEALPKVAVIGALYARIQIGLCGSSQCCWRRSSHAVDAHIGKVSCSHQCSRIS